MNLSKGRKGKFTFKEPFNQHNTNEILEVVYYEKVGTALSNGVNVLKFVYQSVGLTKEDLANDIKNDVWIIGLAKNNGTIIYIPEHYITITPEYDGIVYTHKMISVDLGLLPKDENLDELINDIKILVAHKVGKIPFMKQINVSKDVQVSEEDHREMNIAREVHKADDGNYKKKCEDLISEIEEKNKLITDLECIITKLNC